MSKLKPFDVLAKLDVNDFDYYSGLAADEKSQVSTYMMTKWMSCSNDKRKLEVLNATANQWVFGLSKHPELMYHLLASCGSGKEFYKWKKRSAATSKRPITVKLLKEFYNDSTETAIADSAMMDLESMIEIAERLGYIEEIKKLKKEYK